MRINYFFPQVAYVWFKPYYSGYGSDLDFVRCQADIIGKIPEWYSDYIEQSGFDSFITQGCLFVDGEIQTNIMWCLNNAVCPKQPFCMKIHEPKYYVDYYGECDEDIHTHIYAREKVLNPEEKWSKVLDQIKNFKLDKEIEKLKKQKEIKTKYNKWYIHREADMYNDNIILSLRYCENERTWQNFGTEIISVKGNTIEECKSILFNKIMLNYPELSLKDFMNLKWG
jgi:CRISPR/Cas system-associated endonuclease/helicase Cas3